MKKKKNAVRNIYIKQKCNSLMKELFAMDAELNEIEADLKESKGYRDKNRKFLLLEKRILKLRKKLGKNITLVVRYMKSKGN
jgi:Mg2+ and Co2+ transporter CorA